MSRISKLLLIFGVLFIIYAFTAGQALDDYKAKFDNELQRPFDETVRQGAIQGTKAECLLKEMDRHMAGWDDLKFYSPLSWYRVNNRHFGLGCK